MSAQSQSQSHPSSQSTSPTGLTGLPEELERLLRPTPVHDEYVDLFFPFFANILKLASIAGVILNKRSIEELQLFVESGELLSEEAAAISLTPSLVSLAKAGPGKRRLRPTSNQLVLWCRVLYKYHHSPEYERKCLERNLPQAPFDERHVYALLALAGYSKRKATVEWAVKFAREYNGMASLVEMSPIANDSHPQWRARATTEPLMKSYQQAIEQMDKLEEMEPPVEA